MMREFDYQRLVIGYHGCDKAVRDRVIQKGDTLRAQPKSYDWLGHGAYFWEHGPARALEWAKQQKARGKLDQPAVLGAVLHLGQCFDLLDSDYTDLLGKADPDFCQTMRSACTPIPANEPLHAADSDRLLRKLDCAVVNWTIDQLERDGKLHFHSVRGVFQEGATVFPNSGIHQRSHIQIAVRDPACILGYFVPSSKA
jgi:hypothetical protein